MSPEQAIHILTQVVEQTRMLPKEADVLREALKTLTPKKPEGNKS